MCESMRVPCCYNVKKWYFLKKYRLFLRSTPEKYGVF